MRYTKEINFNGKRARFVSKVGVKSILHLLICALISAGVIALFSVLTFGAGKAPETHMKAIFISLTAVFGIMLVSSVCVLFSKCRLKYNAVADDESLFLRYGSGYIKFNRYEIGEIKTKSRVARGRGDKNFEITGGGIKFSFGNKNRFIRVEEADKLAYVLSNMAQYPDSGVDWGLAYDSK